MNKVDLKSLTNGHAESHVKSSNKTNGESSEHLVTDMADSYRSILRNVGENPHREGLLKTPERAAKALLFFTKGYQESLKGDCAKHF